MNVDNASNVGFTELSKDVEMVDVGMNVDESPAGPTDRYKVLTVPGRPDLVSGLEFDDNFEEDEAEMSSESEDEDEDGDDVEDAKATDISAEVLLEKSFEETDDAEDEDYVPAE